jgi:hypothetical protein
MSDDRDRCPSVRGTAEYGGRVRSPFERQSPRLGVGPVRWLEAHDRAVQIIIPRPSEMPRRQGEIHNWPLIDRPRHGDGK